MSASNGPALVSQLPLRALLIPLRACDLGAGPGALEHAVATGDVLDVLLDLGLRRVAARPARVRFEGELVQMRRHVARRARVGVVGPHAAHPLAALEHGHVVVAGANEQHRRADAAEAASDDRDRAPPAAGGHRPRAAPVGARLRVAGGAHARSLTGSVLSWLTNSACGRDGLRRRWRCPGSASASPRSGSAAPGAPARCRGRSAARRHRTPGARPCGCTSKRSGSS